MADQRRTIEVRTTLERLVFLDAIATIGEGGVLAIDHAGGDGARSRTVLSPSHWQSFETDEPQASLGSIRR